MAHGWPPCWLKSAQDLADQLQLDLDRVAPGRVRVSNEIEWVLGAESSDGRGRVEDYLNLNPSCEDFDCSSVGWAGPLAHDLGLAPEHLYYHPATPATWALSSDSVVRHQYDAVRTFIEQTRARHSFPTRD